MKVLFFAQVRSAEDRSMIDVDYLLDADVLKIDPPMIVSLDVGVYDTEKRTREGYHFTALQRDAFPSDPWRSIGYRFEADDVSRALDGDVEYLRRLRDEIDVLLGERDDSS